jgi:transcription termination factor Rho
MFAILKVQAEEGEEIIGMGTLEVLPDGFGFLRSPEANYLPAPTTSTSAPSQIRSSACAPATRSRARSAPQGGRALLRPGQGRHDQLRDPENVRHKVNFDNLTPLYPDER